MILNKKCEEIELLYIKIDKLHGPGNKTKKTNLRMKIEEETEELTKILDKHQKKKKNQIKLMQSDMLKDQDESVNSSDFDKLQDEKQDDKWKLEPENKFFNNIYSIYITFLCMETKEIISNLYNNEDSKANRLLAGYLKSLYRKHFQKKISTTKTMQETRKNQFRN